MLYQEISHLQRETRSARTHFAISGGQRFEADIVVSIKDDGPGLSEDRLKKRLDVILQVPPRHFMRKTFSAMIH